MIWFGSSAGVGICNRFPEAKHTLRWVREGWHVAVAYVLGVAAFMVIDGWKPYDLAQHPSNPLVSPVIGGSIAAGVAFFALLVGLRHWVMHTDPLSTAFHVPHVPHPHLHVPHPHRPRRHNTAPSASPPRPAERP
jgi:hypothetical protein